MNWSISAPCSKPLAQPSIAKLLLTAGPTVLLNMKRYEPGNATHVRLLMAIWPEFVFEGFRMAIKYLDW
ncbi:hypothetical protein M233_09995 [Xylella fastidiosa subsp. multiplex Griffin-1]|nr:hypothetical protein M233_09995 [Xylella fastidiosa subsp. multiplex Griffin-1]OMJ98672.1 hypothetical protein XYFPCFBP8417_09550 [Xylella fastidiosa subsp. multiplex]RWA36763.1 hypothetical protein XfCFBP8078_11440 [Xylella fastidiosa subsp. multiplex]